MNRDQWLSVCAESVHRQDRDRLMCVSLAPDNKQDALIALLAFNLEITAIPDIVSEALLGEMRLQWWRDAIGSIYEGARQDHPVVLGLAEAIGKNHLTQQLFEEYLKAGSFELSDDPKASLAELKKHAEASAGSLNELMAEVLGLGNLESDVQQIVRTAARQSGMAWAMSNWIYGGRGRYLPATENGGTPVESLAEAALHMVDLSRSLAKQIPKAFLPVMMPVYLASHRLKRLARYDYDTGNQHLHRPASGRLFGFYWKSLTKSY